MKKSQRIMSTISLKIKRPYGKIWHSFKVRPQFNITHDGRAVELSPYFDIFKEDREWWEMSLTKNPEPWMSDYIKKWG
jgi:hypothetical protein